MPAAPLLKTGSLTGMLMKLLTLNHVASYTLPVSDTRG